jgi:hypothetical protein
VSTVLRVPRQPSVSDIHITDEIRAGNTPITITARPSQSGILLPTLWERAGVRGTASNIGCGGGERAKQRSGCGSLAKDFFCQKI